MLHSRTILAVLLMLTTATLSAAPLRVENVMRIKGQETTTIRGIGIVSGLSATGDDPRSYSPAAKAMLRMLELSGQPRGADVDRQGRPRSPEMIVGTSKNNALVEVMVTIPATGARDGDLLDCTVVSVGNAKSLAGGVLSVTTLYGPLPEAPERNEVRGLAWGKLTIESTTASNVGKVKDGCRLTGDFINPYIEDGNMTLVVLPEYADPRMIMYVAESINAYGGQNGLGTIAKAMNQNYIVIRFPREYFGDPMKFVADLMDIEIIMDRPLVPRVMINERVGIIAIDDAVEVKPIVVTHRNIVAEIRPPVPPGEIEVNPQQFVDVDTDTKYRQFQGEPVVNQKLKALQASLDAVRVTPQDMIEIIKILHRQGAIVGDVIYVD